MLLLTAQFLCQLGCKQRGRPRGRCVYVVCEVAALTAVLGETHLQALDNLPAHLQHPEVLFLWHGLILHL